MAKERIKIKHGIGGKAFPEDYNWICPKCKHENRAFEGFCPYCQWEKDNKKYGWVV